MKTVRELILEYLRKNHPATAAELSQMIHVTKADVRYHLKEMIAAGEIEKTAIKQPTWKGRPAYLFQLADKARPGNYRQLAEALFSILNTMDVTSPIIDRLAAHLAQKIPSAKQRATQLNRLVSFFSENAYDASWEAYTNGPRIIFKNCPYAAILPQHPQLCAMDGLIIENYLNLHFSQVSKIEPEKGRIPTCVFQI